MILQWQLLLHRMMHVTGSHGEADSPALGACDTDSQKMQVAAELDSASGVTGTYPAFNVNAIIL